MTTEQHPPPPGLSAEEMQRYARHLILPHVGLEGQQRLKAARVLLVGVGGLGSPASLYLAAAGVGTLGLVDHDVVEASNLQRQVLHGTSAVGRPKLASAAARLLDLNPAVRIVPHEVRLSSANALEILGEYDVVVDGSDNFPTRYLVNDACVLLGKPDVYGSIHRFEGQAAVFWGARGPCYRCLYRDPPPPELVPSCEEAGVLGVLPGIVGAIQAAETIKLLLGVGQAMVGRLLLFDALTMRFRELKLEKDPDCPVCGEKPTVTGLIDYEEFCGVGGGGGDRAKGSDRGGGMEVTVRELKAELDGGRAVVLLDVRQPWEYELCHIAGSRLIPLSEIPEAVSELDPSAEYVTICHTGRRSLQAAQFLKASGVDRVRSLKGGVESWAVEIDKSMARY
ncbi:MAG TPA: molybdopterin-synthase adenylyltransferase MoeB [Gemmatimonadales bacterium]|nr:molybdopterin-synthase adenylyltransferase MoeB [Gemmatimonadales bacterium]